MARARALTLCLAAGLALAQPAAAASAAKPEAKTDGKPNAAAASAEPLPVDTGPPAPWRLLRALQRLQVQMAQGSTVAQQAQAGLVAELTRGFAAADAALWSDRRNAVAALALLLSGADPRDLRKLHDDGAFGDHASLVAAGLAFAEGRTAQARALLEEIDEADLGRIVAAQVALVAATLAARDDPERANALFDRARLLSPGTLVEETARRRQARLAEERSDETRFMRLAAQYARRYGRSVYASDFHVRLPAALTRIALAGKRDDLEAIEP
ncbi:MAG: hypothetical protein JNK46_06160, partial [Methylobacteriaceae bacterium]|nr:hypothetical protein [Methylobacteriaceae bacterium]